MMQGRLIADNVAKFFREGATYAEPEPFIRMRKEASRDEIDDILRLSYHGGYGRSRWGHRKVVIPFGGSAAVYYAGVARKGSQFGQLTYVERNPVALAITQAVKHLPGELLAILAETYDGRLHVGGAMCGADTGVGYEMFRGMPDGVEQILRDPEYYILSNAKQVRGWLPWVAAKAMYSNRYSAAAGLDRWRLVDIDRIRRAHLLLRNSKVISGDYRQAVPTYSTLVHMDLFRDMELMHWAGCDEMDTGRFGYKAMSDLLKFYGRESMRRGSVFTISFPSVKWMCNLVDEWMASFPMYACRVTKRGMLAGVAGYYASEHFRLK